MEEMMAFTDPHSDEPFGLSEDREEPASSKEAVLMTQLAELTSCVNQATSAICQNDVSMFEETLTQQQILCAEISSTLRSVIGGENSRLPQHMEVEVVKAAHQNFRFLLLLEKVTLHAHSLQRLYRDNLGERWDADTQAIRVREGRYV